MLARMGDVGWMERVSVTVFGFEDKWELDAGWMGVTRLDSASMAACMDPGKGHVLFALPKTPGTGHGMLSVYFEIVWSCDGECRPEMQGQMAPHGEIWRHQEQQRPCMREGS